MYFNTSINLIKVPNRFNHSKPNEDKMEACREFYRTNHRLDRDIVVDENMVLKDGYIGYLVLIENEAKVVCVKQTNTRQVTLVYGVHPGVDKEYRWKMVDDTEGSENLKIGSHTIVRTTFGDVEVTVTKIEKITRSKLKTIGHIKRVVKCLPE